jgi:peroxiredoxin
MDVRKVTGYAIVAVLVGVLVVQYVRAVGPSADDDRLSACRAMSPMPINPALGKFPTKAPDFEAADFTGAMVPLSAYRGKVVLLNFWNTNCQPCIDEMASMEALQKTVGADKMVILALASETAWDPIRQFFPSGTPLTVLLDPPDSTHAVGQISRRYGTEQWPETYVIDKNGTIRYYFINSRKWSSDNGVACARALANE